MKEMIKQIVYKSLDMVLKRMILRALPPGTRRKRKDGLYEKQSDGTWLRVKEKPEKKKEEEKDYSTKEEMEMAGNKVATELNINPDNIYIHSSTIDGITELFEKGQENYLSASTFDGSTKFIEKGSETIYFILESTDIRFHEWGDVGWEGGDPRKTSYDEAGLDDWNVKGLVIPPYLKDDKKTIGRALIAKQVILENSNYEIDLKLIGANPKLLSEVDNEIYEFGVENEDLEIDEYYEKLRDMY